VPEITNTNETMKNIEIETKKCGRVSKADFDMEFLESVSKFLITFRTIVLIAKLLFRYPTTLLIP
jgi:hypothetical protein